jgi:multidrug efflux pump subunit AcrA (membrane-fusion protein)
MRNDSITSPKPPHHPDLDDLTLTRPAVSPATSSTRKVAMWIVITVLLLGISAYWLIQTSPGAAPVQLGTVQSTAKNALQPVLTASGYVVAQRQASVASKGTGRLTSLMARVGDRVRKGQIIDQAGIECDQERAPSRTHLHGSDA